VDLYVDGFAEIIYALYKLMKGLQMLKKIALATALCSVATFASAEGAATPTVTLSTQTAPLIAGFTGATVGTIVASVIIVGTVAGAATNGS